MRQLTIIPTGNEMFMFEKAYSKEDELGSNDFIPFTLTRPTLIKEALKYTNQLIMPHWRRHIDKSDKGTEFSRNYPDNRYRMTLVLEDEEYSKLDNFAYKRSLSLTEAALLLIRNYTAVVYENPDMLKGQLGSKPKVRKDDDRVGVMVKLEKPLYDWFTVQAVSKGQTTGGFIRRTLERIYEKNTGGQDE